MPIPTYVLAATSDQHCGSSVALCPPRIQLDDGGEYVASAAQRWIWTRWEGFWGRVREVVKQHRGARLLQVFNGDLTEGDHHKTTQILSGNPTAQAAVVNAAMKVPLGLDPFGMFFVRGTEAHVGPSAAFEERIAFGLKRDGWPVQVEASTGNASHWHVALDLDGYRVDVAHHGRMGQRPWTKGNVVLNLAAEIFYQHAAAGRPHPHLAIRSHLHQFFDTAGAHPVRLIQMPAWQLATAYIHRIAPNAIADVGGIIAVVRGGRLLSLEPVISHPDATPAWRPAA